jgi:peptidyl-prolyl cis-trans isomerase C
MRPSPSTKGAFLLAAVAALAGCNHKPAPGRKASAGQVILAQIDDLTITDADLREVLARYASQPFVAARYSSPEKRKDLLDSLVRYQVLALEARKRGYENDPEVVRVAKEKMVRLFTQQEIFDKIKASDISDADVEKYYKDHAGEYVRPEAIRVSEILVKSPAKAAKVLAEARALPKMDMKGFRELVAKYSEDADSKPRGGDLMQFDRKSTHYAPALVAAAFALKEVGDVSDLVSTPQGHAILKLSERRAALSQSLDDSRIEIRRRLLDDLRNKRKKEFVDQARKLVKIEVFEDELRKLDLGANSTIVDAGVLGARP